VIFSHSRAEVTGRTRNFSILGFRAVGSVDTLGVDVGLVAGAEIASGTVVRLRTHSSTEGLGRAGVRLASSVGALVTSFTRLGVHGARRTESTFSAIPALFFTAIGVVRNPG